MFLRPILVLFVVFDLSICAVHRVHVERRTSLREKLVREGKWTEHVQRQEARKQLAKSLRLASHRQGLNDYADAIYVANITLGSPPQMFQVIFDTTSGYTFVPDIGCDDSSSCNTFGCNIPFACNTLCDRQSCCTGGPPTVPAGFGCDNVHKFNASASDTYEQITNEILSVDQDGLLFDMILGSDKFAFGTPDTHPLEVPKVTFGQTVLALEVGVDEMPADGFVGLALPESTGSQNIIPPFIEAINQGLVDSPIFTIYLEEEGAMAVNVAGGSITFGGLDTDNCGDVIAYHPITSVSIFEFPLNKVSVGKYSEFNPSWRVVSATHKAFIYGPTSSIQKIAAEYGGTFNTQYHLYTVDCKSKLSDLQLTVGSIVYAVKGKHLITQFAPGLCVLALAEADDSDHDWQLGVPFIQSYCNVFDVGQMKIGFALPKKA